ncbi:integrase [Bacillus sp. PS06]|uniref:integrase n=2 Tax=Bacillaceae TaxID=186817 RepID=UPI001783CC0D|nr:integrase [Bacillus sp. PS06]MBD8068100.1 integrase [Bacillus sp. PS06]
MNIEQTSLHSTIVEEIESLSDTSFLTTESINEAVNILKNEPLHYSGDFDDDEWIFHINNLNTGLKRKLKFKELKAYESVNHIPNNFQVIVKCWVADLIPKYHITTVAGYYLKLLKFLEYTDGFDQEKDDEFVLWFTSTQTISNKDKQYTIYVILNFLDYADIEAGEVYIKPLLNLKKKVIRKKANRTLPPSKDILAFSQSIDFYYQEIKSSNCKDMKWINEKLLYYPIIIWWKLTTIIPLRPSEFCSIKRNCLSEGEGNYYLHLPRHKYQKKHPNVVDKVRIDQITFELISAYIDETDKYGNSDTLISYNSVLKTSSYFIRSIRETQKININVFNIEQLYLWIQIFYEKIVRPKYGFNIPQKNQLRPNDTRHLAIFSLMMQGVSPIEIARLANHNTISMQLNYAHHTEYWIDSEVFSLLQKFKFAQSYQSNPEISSSNKKKRKETMRASLDLAPHIPNDILLKAFRPPTTPDCKKPLKDIGYCSDEQQRCETEDCIFCNHWRITPEELAEKSHIIKEKLASSKRNINELITFMKNLHSIMLSDEFSRVNPTNLNKLKSISYQIKDSVKEIADLKVLEVHNNG